MELDKQLLLLVALKKAEAIYFSGGDWKGFVLNLMLEIETHAEKEQFPDKVLYS